MLNKEIVRITRHCQNSGLCSFIMTMIDTIIYCLGNGKIPVIDWININNPCFPRIDNKNNWEYYFKQPFINIPYDEYEKMNVITWSPAFFGLSFKPSRKEKMIFGSDILNPTKDILDNVDKFWYDNCYGKNVLGVRIRGTDYNAHKPKFHQIQPNIDMICDDIDFILSNNQIDVIFASTESVEYKDILQKRYSDRIRFHQSMFFNNNSNYLNPQFVGKNYSPIDVVKMNMEYIESICILARCQYVLTANNNSAELYQYLRRTEPTYEKIYNLGVY